MTLFLRDLMDRFDQLSLRERVIVLIATLLPYTPLAVSSDASAPNAEPRRCQRLLHVFTFRYGC